MIDKHPVWLNRAPFWRVWLECWRGGEYFRAASVQSTGVIQAGSQAVIQRWTWGEAQEDDPVPAAAWLWSHSRESDEQYAERVARSSFRRYAGFACDVLAAGVTEGVSTPTTRLPPEWLARVTLQGHDLRAFRRSMALLTSIFGHCWIGADRDRAVTVTGEDGQTRDADPGTLPYLYLLSPLDVIDWQVSKGYELEWALVRERMGIQRDLPTEQLRGAAMPMGRSAETVPMYRLWTREYSQTFDRNGKPMGGKQTNALGRVPLEIAFYTQDTGCVEPMGIGVMQDLAPVNLHEYNMRSLRDVILTDTCFPFLAIARPQGETRIDPETQVEIGTDRALAYDAAGGPPLWVQPSPESVVTITDMIREDVQSMRELAGLKIANEDSAAAISADALRLIRATLDARFAAHAANLQDAEIRALKMVQELAGLGPDGIEDAWPADYGAQESGGRLDDIAKALDAGLRESPLAHAELLKSAVQVVLPSAPQRVLKQINVELDQVAVEIKEREEEERQAQADALAKMAENGGAKDGAGEDGEKPEGDAPGPPGRAGRDARPPRGGGE